MRIANLLVSLFLLAALEAAGHGQQLMATAPTAPAPQPAHVTGTVMDTNGDLIPGATVTLTGPSQSPESVTANDNGFFEIDNVIPGNDYRVTASAKGFAEWDSSTISLQPGQFEILNDVRLRVLAEATSVTVVASQEELARQEVKIEEHQRVLGVIPNFYVSYDKDAPPLTPRLKFELALKVAVDPVTFVGTTFLAATNQAAHYPDYVEGMRGYGERFGAGYANDLTDIMVGGAILPSILHQDPRYFYQGTGTKKSRLMHALSSPIITREDNGHWGPNYSSLGGYLASGAIANAYYPESNRGPGLVFHTFAVDVSANIANGVLQEFVLRKFTPTAKDTH